MRWLLARISGRRRSRLSMVHRSFPLPERLEERSLAGGLVPGEQAGWLEKFKIVGKDSMDLFHNPAVADQLVQDYVAYVHGLGVGLPRVNPSMVMETATTFPYTAGSEPVVATITPVFNASDSSSPYMPYHTSSNLSPLYLDVAVPAGPAINDTIIDATYQKGPSPPVSVTAAHGHWRNITYTHDGQGSMDGPLSSMQINVSDTVSLGQDVGRFKYLNLASSSHVDHLVYDLQVLGPDFEDFGDVDFPVDYSGGLVLSCDPGDDWVGGLMLSADGVQVISTGGGVTIHYSTALGPQTYTDSSFYLTGGTIALGFSGINTTGANDVAYSWLNDLELDNADPGTGDSSQLNWDYSITYGGPVL